MVEITSKDVTDGSDLHSSGHEEYVVTGDGSFDDLMEACTKHLDAQYQLGRIVGDEYAKVYLGMLTASMQSSVQFELQRHEAAKKAELLGAQIAQITAEVKKQWGFGNVSFDEEGMMVLGESTEDGLIDYQHIDMQSQTKVRDEQSKSDLATKSITRTDIASQTTVRDEQSTSDLLTKIDTRKEIAAKVNLTIANRDLVRKQIDKVIGEIDLVKYKADTEYAQTRNKLPAESGGLDVKGVIVKQKTLYDQQAASFLWNAKQKWAKLTTDLDSVYTSSEMDRVPENGNEYSYPGYPTTREVIKCADPENCQHPQ